MVNEEFIEQYKVLRRMSRYSEQYKERFTLVTGKDHVLGDFVQLLDSKHTNPHTDCIFDWDEMLGTTVNLLTKETKSFIVQEQAKQFCLHFINSQP